MVDWLPAILIAVAVTAAAFLIARASIGRWTVNGGRWTKTGMVGWADIVRRWELPTLLLLGPLFLFSPVVSVVGVAVILALWVGRWLVSGFFLPRTPLDWPLALMCAMIPVGMFASPDMGWSVGRAELLVYGVALYYAIVAWIDRPSRLQMATLVYLGAGGVMAGLALVGTAWEYKVPVLGDVAQWFPQVAQGLARNSGGFHPNIVAGALLWVVMPLLALLLGTRGGRRWTVDDQPIHAVQDKLTSGILHTAYCVLRDRRVLWGLLVLTGGTLVLTQSRGALVGAAVGAGLLVWLRWPQLRLAVAAIGVAAVVLVGGMLAGWWGGGPTQAVSPTTPLRVYDDNFAVRVDTWRSALHGIGEYPITGIGLDAFRWLMPVRYPAPSVPDSYDIGHAHNQFLQAALDLGLPGLVGYLAVWITAGWMVLGRRTVDRGRWTVEDADELRITNDELPPSIVLRLPSAIGIALLASFVHGLADTVVMVSKPGVLFWAMLALLAASWRLTRMRGDSTLQR